MPKDAPPHQPAGARNFVTEFLNAHAASNEAGHKPLDEAEYLQEALNYANGDWAAVVPLLTGKRFSESQQNVYASHMRSLPTYQPKLQSAFSTFLDKLTSKDQRRPMEELWPEVCDASGRVALIPFVEHAGNRLNVTMQIVPSALDAGLGYAGILLLAENRSYGAALCKCKLQTCGNYFFEHRDPDGGAPRRTYCSQAHMSKAHSLGNLERVRRSRERKKAKDRRRR